MGLRNAKLGSLVLLAFLLIQCTYLREITGTGTQKPQIQLKSLKFKNISASLELSIELNIFNPNTFDLTFSQLDYRVLVNELILADGQYHEKIELPAGEQIFLKLPAHIRITSGLLSLSQKFLNQEPILATWSAKAYFHSPFGLIKVSSSDQKQF